jgi:hypothetical protein
VDKNKKPPKDGFSINWHFTVTVFERKNQHVTVEASISVSVDCVNVSTAVISPNSLSALSGYVVYAICSKFYLKNTCSNLNFYKQ